MIKLDNHRQLKPDEIIRKGDFYKTNLGTVRPVKFSIGETPSSISSHYNFFRRKHTKKQAVTFTPYRKGGDSGTFTKATKKSVAKYPTVTFAYKGQRREVQVIELNVRYLTGLEVSHVDTGLKYQFKKFLRSRLQTPPVLVALADKE